MDPLSLSTIGAETLTMGIQFLYAQAGELLKRWRERREGGDAGQALPAPEAGSAVLRNEPQGLTVDDAALERLAPEIRELRASLAEYAEGIEKVAPDNTGLVQVTDALRAALECVLGEDLTFQGEERPAHDPDVGVEVTVDDVAGYVAGIRANQLVDGRLRVDVKAKRVLPGGRVVGADFTGEPEEP